MVLGALPIDFSRESYRNAFVYVFFIMFIDVQSSASKSNCLFAFSTFWGQGNIYLVPKQFHSFLPSISLSLTPHPLPLSSNNSYPLQELLQKQQLL